MAQSKQQEESQPPPAAEVRHFTPKKSTKERPTRQLTIRPRQPPRAPGLVSVSVDIAFTMTMQLFLVITNFIVTGTSFAYSGEGVFWVILAEIVFTYVGFAYFVNRISRQILVYKRFFKRLNEWHDAKLEAIQRNGSCYCWCVFVKLAWWVMALLMFPFIIGWSMVQIYKWRKDQNRNAEAAEDLTQIGNVGDDEERARQYWKMTDHAYSVWHLGVLSKQASMVVMFLQDIPLLVIACIISNYLGIIVYAVSIVLKLVFWCKHMWDLKTCTMFYSEEHYLNHFGILQIHWSNEFGCDIILADFFNEYERELSTLQVADWVELYDEASDKWQVMVVWKSFHFKERDNLVLVEWDKVDKKAIEDLDNGLASKVTPDPQAVHTVNRWDGNVQLLRNDDYVRYHDNEGRDEEERPANGYEMDGTAAGDKEYVAVALYEDDEKEDSTGLVPDDGEIQTR